MDWIEEGSTKKFLDMMLDLVSAAGEPWLSAVPVRRGGEAK